MRPLLIGFAFFAAVVVVVAACSQDPGSAATSTSGTSGTGGAPNCDGIVIVLGEDAGNSCDVCLHKKCCAEVANCADQECKVCVNGDASGCGNNPHVKELNDCIDLYCHDSTSCYPVIPPLTSSSTGGSGTGGSASSSASSG
jgi:hypothetical protein